jgi:sec-independent protein translocase protein TatB
MFQNLGWPEIMVLVLLGLFIFGPDRLPKLITDAANVIRQLRRMAANATGDLSRELGTDISIEDLNPKTFVRKHLLSDDDQELLTKPFRELASDVQETGRSLESSFDVNTPLASDAAPDVPAQRTGRAKFDVDAT